MNTLVGAHEPAEPKRVTSWPLSTTANGTIWLTQPTGVLALTNDRRWASANANSKTEYFN